MHELKKIIQEIEDALVFTPTLKKQLDDIYIMSPINMKLLENFKNMLNAQKLYFCGHPCKILEVCKITLKIEVDNKIIYTQLANIFNKIIKINDSMLLQLLTDNYDLAIYSIHFSIHQIFKFLYLILPNFDLFLDTYSEFTTDILEKLLATKYKDAIFAAIADSNITLPYWFWNKISPITNYNLLYFITRYQEINDDFINKNIKNLYLSDINYIVNYQKNVSNNIKNQLKILKKFI